MAKAKAVQASGLEKFMEAVRYMLVHGSGMPELVADEVMKADRRYIEQAFDEIGIGEGSVCEVAEQLQFKRPTGGDRGGVSEWRRIEEGQVVLSIDGRVGDVVRLALETGLYGATTEDVVSALLRRGLEVILPVLHVAPGASRG